MTESEFTRRLLKKLREHPALKDKAVIWKHANYFTKGVPDFSVTIGARTTWWEVKRYGERPTKIQQYFLDRIGAEGAATITMNKEGNGAVISAIDWDECECLIVDHVVEEITARSLPH